MQPMVSAGKLFEPKLKENREGIDGGVGANDVLEPTYERQRDGPRITINTDDDEDDNNGESILCFLLSHPNIKITYS